MSLINFTHVTFANHSHSQKTRRLNTLLVNISGFTVSVYLLQSAEPLRLLSPGVYMSPGVHMSPR